jgi:iron only hydrogenase large subunit-like protein/uncharacterized Fe-S cluster-containing protein
MDRQHPIFTEKKECQDCYKCVRNCPVKAIRVENGSAMVMAERCVVCGKCVGVCPVHAKRVRDDMGRVRHLLASGEKVVVSLAPSFVSEFPDIPAGKLIAALKKLGFAAVSETALGAQEVSATVAEALKDPTPRVLLSSACPVVVELVNKYMPAHADKVTALCSPLLAHCRLLRQTYGEDVKIVFIGPCIAKKLEADEHPDLLEIAISFRDLRGWLEAEHIFPVTLTAQEDDVFGPEVAHEGALYPVDGGMIAGIKANCPIDDAGFMAFSGFEHVRDALQFLDRMELRSPLFLELLACEGGCVNGPQTAEAGATVMKRFQVLGHAEYSTEEFPRTPRVDAVLDRHGAAVEESDFADRDLRRALASVGKYHPDDELNCGGCGYASCRDFAAALLIGKAETTMCVSYMRKLAQNKANALIEAMPSGVIIVNADLSIVECNRRLAEIVGGDLPDIYDAKPGMEGADASRVMPFLVRHIRKVLDTGENIVGRDVRHEGAVYHISVFDIEPGRIVGAVVQDVTAPAVHKDRVVRKAQEVIHKQMETVQKIAYLLGENAADSQVSLNAIIESFSAEQSQGESEDG